VIRGFFKETLPAFSHAAIKFAHVDADLYVSIKEVNEWLLPRLVRHGIVVYDDYGFSSCLGALQAVDEDISARDDFFTLYLPTGQFMAMKIK
jgi:O-methyltransferase